MNFTRVDGRGAADIRLYALSTCVWCRRVKALLAELGLAYDYVNVDELEESEMDDAEEQVSRLNPHCSYPTLVVNGERCIVGFHEDEIRELAAL